MRLIFLNRFFHPDESATSQLLTDLCVHLAARGHEVHVIASRQRHEDPRSRLPATESWGGVRVHRVATTHFGRLNLLGRAFDYATFYVFAGLRLWGLGRRASIAVALTDPPLISVVAALVCPLRRMRLVNWVQDVFPEVAERLNVRVATGAAGRVMTGLRNRSLRAAACNVALASGMAVTLRAHAAKARVEIIHNWADGASIRPLPRSRNALREAWRLGERFVVGYSGNLGRAHEFDTILDACARLRDREDIVFLIVGAGPQRARLEEESARRRLSNLRFQPFQPRARLSESLCVPDVHLVTLRPELEGLVVPSKVYGIAAAGRPLVFVGNPGGEVSRMIHSAGCGVSIETGDAEGLAAAIAQFAGDIAHVERLGARARAAFEATYESRQALQRWESMLSSL